MPYQHIYSRGFDFAEVPDSGQEPVRFGYDGIRAGMFVGYFFRGAHGQTFWRKGYVIGMDRDIPSTTVAIVQQCDGTVDTFHSDCDALIHWKD